MFGKGKKVQSRQESARPSARDILYDNVSPELAALLAAEARRDAREPEAHLVSQRSRAASVFSDVLVPLLQSLITGVIALLVASVVFGRDAQAGLAWGIGTFAAVWLVQLIEVRNLVRAAEQIFQVDFDRDHHIGPIQAPPPDVIVNNRGPSARNAAAEPVKVGASPVHPFQRFVELCNSEGTDERFLNEQGFTRRVQVRWRDQLIRAGWAVWKSYDADGLPNVNTGWTLVAPPEELLANVAYKANATVTVPFRKVK